MAISIGRVQFEHHREPIGIGEPTPRISWRFNNHGVTNWMQTSYEIEITRHRTSSHAVYAVESGESVLVPWPSQPLQSGDAASVRIRAFGRPPHGGATPWSDTVTVEAGLLKRSDWSCSLISSGLAFDAFLPKQPVLFRRTFMLTEAAKTARLYITAHGLYEAHINGQRVGDHVLAPGWTSYDHRLVYQTYDVTHLLQKGHNIIAAQVAEGWFSGRLGFLGGVRNIWGDTLGLMAKLDMEAADGNKTVINTDSDWKCATGGLVTSEIYDGEVCDLNQEPKGWQGTGFNDTSWVAVKSGPLPTSALVSPDGPPVKMIEELQIASVLTTPSGKTVVDFAQNIVGWVRMRLRGPKGHKIKLLFTEELENGEVATRPLRICKASDSVILSGQDQTWEPKFTFHGFRYVQIEGHDLQGGEFDIATMTAVVVHTDMEQTGWFECSNPLLNQLHNNIRWGMRGNFVSIPTDCPQRDERLGWTGDIHVFGPTATYLYDVSGMLKGWLKDVAAEQLAHEKAVPPFFCPNVFLQDTRYPTAIWGDVVVGLPWTLYRAYRDAVILSEQLESMQQWMSKGIPRDKDTNLWEEASYQFGDWLDPLAPPDDPGNSITDPLLVANAYLVHMTCIMHQVHRSLGHADKAEAYRDSAARLKAAYQQRYLSPEGRVVCDSQTALALSIHFQLFESASQELVAAARLRHLILRNSRFKIATGFAGTPIMGHALSRVGEAQLFYRMLYHRKAPSWLYQVTMGATTMWERWDSKLPDGSINPGEMTSFNHYALGAVADWMHQHIAGLSPLEPGWRTFSVAPAPGGDLTSAKATFLSPYGTISVGWTIQGTQFAMTLTVPPNCTAEVRLPCDAESRSVTVGSGVHHYTKEYTRPAWPPLPLYPQYYPHDDDEP